MREKILGQVTTAVFMSVVLGAGLTSAQDVRPKKGTVEIRSPGPAKKPVVRPVTVTAELLEQLAKSDFKLPAVVSSRSRSELRRVVEQINKGNNANAQKYWSDVIKTQPNIDVNGLIQWVLRECYIETVEAVRLYGEELKHLNGLKRAIRAHLNGLRRAENQMQSRMDRESAIEIEAITCIPKFYHTGVRPKPEMTRTRFDRRALVEYIKNVEEELSSIGEDAQLANIDLQNALQKQQQMVQMLSNVSKMLHDTATAVIRKMG